MLKNPPAAGGAGSAANRPRKTHLAGAPPPYALFIQNNPIEGPGYLMELFERDGLDATVIGPDGGIPGSAEGPVVILGGPQSANEDSPRLRAEEELVRNCHRRDVPVLGVCLGSQLAAKALGGRVYAGGLAEMGFHDDVIPDRTSALFGGAPDPYWVFHWHQDTFELPPGAAVLAGSPAYANQAFIAGSVVGLQFHLEVDLPTVQTWLGVMAGQRGAAPRNSDRPEDRLPAVRSNMDAFYSGFKRLFSL